MDSLVLSKMLSDEDHLEVDGNLVTIEVKSNINLRKGTFVISQRFTTKSAPRNKLERQGVIQAAANMVDGLIEASYAEIDEYNGEDTAQGSLFDKSGNPTVAAATE